MCFSFRRIKKKMLTLVDCVRPNSSDVEEQPIQTVSASLSSSSTEFKPSRHVPDTIRPSHSRRARIEFPGEPMYRCFSCKKDIPVVDWRHYSRCKEKKEAGPCKFCRQGRTDRPREQDVNNCNGGFEYSVREEDASIFDFQLCKTQLELFFKNIKEEVLADFKRSMVDGSGFPFICFGCTMDTKSKCYSCTANLPGPTFLNKMNNFIDNAILPTYMLYTESYKDAEDAIVEKEYEEKWKIANPTLEYKKEKARFALMRNAAWCKADIARSRETFVKLLKEFRDKYNMETLKEISSIRNNHAFNTQRAIIGPPGRMIASA
ncbi:hypothetical protein L5515_019377 [Caenorhabditis briggsae]|uniref:Uncharacterized protein n=1 Tax=Caenorhabditis briggsae TaxID=6238 RepID=A0AAE9JTN2_CAEBR|nr:hypothetical protein L5515_019377 [Caenorhabditis briggsae]